MSKSLRSRRRLAAPLSFVLLTTLNAACAAEHSVVRRGTAGLDTIAWFEPLHTDDVATLARWRTAVGPPVVRQRAGTVEVVADEIAVVSWNTDLDSANVPALARTLPPGIPVVLLLQEAYRHGTDVPADLGGDAEYGRFLRTRTRALDIERLADVLGMNAYYVPSMRNGGPHASREDRGNAILSNLPLETLTAIELPFERQRRVAVAATIVGTTTAGSVWRLRVVSAHLDNMGGVKRAWLGGEYGRVRQARGLLEAISSGAPMLVGGDFNTWFGFSDQAYRELARAFPETRVTDRRPTFAAMLRLDHVFYRLAPSWRAEFRRGPGRFGSDHYPLIGSIRFR